MEANLRPPRRAGLLYAAQLVGLASVYVVLGKLGLAIVPVSGFATLVWPPSGVALAALLLGGYRLWPGVAAGAFVTSLWNGAPPLVACGIAAGNTVEAVAGTFALRRIPGFQSALCRFVDVIALAALAALLCTTISATVGVASLVLGDAIPAAPLARTWLVWWTGDLVGTILIAPALLTWAHRSASAPRRAEAALLGGVLIAGTVLVFGAPPDAVARQHVLQPYVLFLPLIWAAIRFGTRGAATAMLAVGAAAVAGTYLGRGAFVRAAGPTESLVALHVFLTTSSIAALVLGAVVTERERSRSELRDHESLLGAILDGANDAIFVKDRAGRYLMMNAAGERIVGRPLSTMVGNDDAAIFPPEEARALQESDAEVQRTGHPQTAEEYLTTGGQPHVYLTTKTPYRDRSGNVIGVIGIARDITDRKNEELARAWLAAIVESSADAVIGMQLDGTITSWNAAAERLYGYTPAEAIGRSITMVVPPDRTGELAGLLERVGRGEPIHNYETARRRKDGTTVDVALTKSPIRDAAGGVIGAATIARDITESAERQRLAVEAAHLGLWFWNRKGDRLAWTPLCRSMYGVGADEEVCCARFIAAVHPDDRLRTERAVAAALAGRADYRIEHRAVWPDGSVHWLAVLGRAFYDDTGALDRMLGVVRDVTAQKRADEERAELLAREQAARAEAQAATRAKDEFLAVVSHELRTPLQAMVGWTHVLRGRCDGDPVARKGLEVIDRNAHAQAQLIADLLDVSRIVAGKLRMERRRVDLARVVEAAVESASFSTEAKSIVLDASLGPLEGDVLGDPDRLLQIVSNLLSNAVKFTPAQGRITVRLAREGTSAWLAVGDSGCGISADFLPHVFDRFRQAECPTSRAHGGLGLGLAIVRHIVAVHGGTVRAESRGEGRGSTFTVTLPLISARCTAVTPEPRDATRGEPGRVELGGVRVLVVDDDPDARELLGTVLHASGADVHAVASAPAALVELATFGPDLLLSDVGMPGEDGYSLIRKVRAHESAAGGHVPAVALTAFTSDADREQALAVGFDAHLAKPASPRELTVTVARLVKRGIPARA